MLLQLCLEKIPIDAVIADGCLEYQKKTTYVKLTKVRSQSQINEICCSLNVKQGRITEISITGNFFGNQDMDKIEEALADCPYEYNSVRQKLETVFCDGAFTDISPADIARIICS